MDKERLLLFMKSRGCHMNSIRLIASGGNSNIYQATASQGLSYAIKQYSRVEAINNERLDREFTALTWMSEQGVATVPRALFKDENHHLGIYEWVSGNKVTNVARSDIDQLVIFLGDLKQKAHLSDSSSLAAAKDACLCANDVLSLIEGRFQRLCAVESEYVEVKAFVEQKCMRLYATLKQRLQSIYEDNHLDPHQDLSREHQTLSPSDYGFHNALCDQQGRLTFLDFEYFGLG